MMIHVLELLGDDTLEHKDGDITGVEGLQFKVLEDYPYFHEPNHEYKSDTYGV